MVQKGKNESLFPVNYISLCVCVCKRKGEKREGKQRTKNICQGMVSPVCVCMRTHAQSVVSNSLPLHGLELAKLLCPWTFPGTEEPGGLQSMGS